MACYRPLISKLWKQEQPQLRPDIRGHPRPESVTNVDPICHADTAFRDRHYVTQEHSPRVQRGPPAVAPARESRGVLSLGLPLGISSLKLGSRRHRRKQKKKGETGSSCHSPSGHVSDGEIISGARTQHWYRALGSSRQTINDEDDLIGLKQTNTHHQPAVTKSLAPAARKSSPGRKSQIGSARYDNLCAAARPRSVSVDADLLMQSAVTSETRAACQAARVGDKDSSELKFAGLTSPSRFMLARDKSSSGNSSGSDVTADTDSDTWPHAALRPGHVASTPARHVSRGRAPVSVVTSQAPPPRHLLPSKLRPSPGVKCHPYIALPQHLTSRDFNGTPTTSLTGAGAESGDELSSGWRGHASRDVSPFGVSRGNTPSVGKRHVSRSKSETPSPLDHGYQTLEHSYDGESSLGSDTCHVATRVTSHVSSACHLLSLNDGLLTRILANIRGSRDLARLGATCSRLRTLVWQPGLWASIGLSDSPLVASDTALRAILARLVWSGPQAVGASCVRSVSLSGVTRTSDRSLALIARNCPLLARLELVRCRGVTNGGILDLVNRCQRLSHLDLTGCPMISSIPVTRTRSSASASSMLSFLDMSECSALDDTGLTMTLLHCPRLTHLYIRKCHNVSDAGVRSIAVYCPGLRELSVSQCPNVSDSGLCELAKLGPSLRYLSVSKCDRVTDTGLRHLVSHCYKLRYLNTRGCSPVTDASLLSLASSCTRLRSLDLGKCDVSDNGLRHLAHRLPGLRKLSVRGCQLVGNPGVLAVARGCRDLVTLNIMECDVSLQTVNIVSRELKRCYIESSYHHFSE